VSPHQWQRKSPRSIDCDTGHNGKALHRGEFATLHLYDDLAGNIRPFEAPGETVKIYVCGITPYDATHLGHAFTFVAFDVLIRYLRYLGRKVRYVQNVTDIDDPLFERAEKIGVPYQDLARDETEQYLTDMRNLNVLPPEVFPYASLEIPAMIDLVQRLIDKGHAYQVGEYVYFSVASDPRYGELSGLNRDAMIALARERGGDPDDPRRRDPLDFLLWRPSKAGEPAYPSPWGEGLPGWHLECSAMALKYLGAPVDIHGGGADLIFPHHESEIAQSEAATGIRPFARFWMHTGIVCLGGEKMSKSLGNMVFVRDLLPRYGPDAIRLYLSGSRYRAELHHDDGLLDGAADLADRLTRAAQRETTASAADVEASEYRAHFLDRMDDDLDSPGAIAVLSDLADAILREPSGAASQAQSELRSLGSVLGLRLGRHLLDNTQNS
jgi:L-cysteine:1D-myo-inositol 2-amino-2-deoxy-alpha-D-glucopyranoside ligase